MQDQSLPSQRSLKTTRPIAKLREGRTDWYRITNLVQTETQQATAEIAIYDEIGFFGITAADFIHELNALDVEQIDLRLNSPGGEVYDGIAIYNALKEHSAKVNVKVDALAASIASVIVQAGDTIEIANNAEMMIHDGLSLVLGNAKDMRDMADRLDRVSQNIASIYAANAGGKIADWREAMQAETWYSAKEAVKAGLAHSVYTPSRKTSNSWDLSVFNYQGRSNAPDPTVAAQDVVAVEEHPVQNEQVPTPWYLSEWFRSSLKEAKK